MMFRRSLRRAQPAAAAAVAVARTSRAVILEAVESRRLMSVTPDVTFGNAGAAQYSSDNGMGVFNTISAVTADDGVVSVGELDFSESTLLFTKLTADGHLDPSFGNNGQVSIDLGLSDVTINPNDLKVAADGSIYVAAEITNNLDWTPQNAFVIHVNADGSFDSGFANGAGLAMLTDGARNVSTPHLAIADGGSVYVAYTLPYVDDTFQQTAGIAKLTPGGAFDGSFDVDGTVNVPIQGNLGQVAELFVDADGTLTVAGDTRNGDTTNEAVPHSVFFFEVDGANGAVNGTLDTVEGDAVVTQVVGSNFFTLTGVARTASGGYVVGGVDSDDFFQTTHSQFTKLNADFSLDAGFGTGGTYVVPADGSQFSLLIEGEMNTVAVDDNGYIFGVGQAVDGATGYPLGGVVRVAPDGQSSESFLYTASMASIFSTALVDSEDRALAGGINELGGLTVRFETTDTDTVPVNHAPTVEGVTGPATVNAGVPATFTATFGDVDGDALEIAWDFGDGSPIVWIAASGNSATASHTFTTAGNKTVTFSVRDAALSATGTTTVLVTTPPPPTPYTVSNGKLSLTATSGNDSIVVTKNAAGQTVLSYNGTTYVVGAGITGLFLDGGAGDDFIRVSAGVTTNSVIVGGAGNDTLRGGNGNDIILAGAGNDVLIGRDGQDILVGGEGADLIIGREDDDILISGTTTLSEGGLANVLAEWTSNHNILVKLANISGLLPLPGRLNGGAYLTPGVTVFNDSSVDTLAGGQGADLYFYTLFGGNADRVNDGLATFSAPIAALVNGD